MAPNELGTSTATRDDVVLYGDGTGSNEPMGVIYVTAPAARERRPAFKPWTTLAPVKPLQGPRPQARFPAAFRPVTAFACGRCA